MDRLSRAQASQRGYPPRPGDLFVFTETAELDVLWAVLERHSSAAERLLVVPADINPLAGSTDIVVPAQAPFGAMTLRCRFGVWIDEEAFDPALRTGFLTTEDLERARYKRADVECGRPVGSVLERETDAEPEYQDWTAGLSQAQAALGEAHEDEGGESPERNETRAQIARLLDSWEDDSQARAGLLPFLAGEMRHAVGVFLDAAAPGYVLQPAALVAEVYRSLPGSREAPRRSRLRFCGVVAGVLRFVLADQAAGAVRVALDKSLRAAKREDVDPVVLDTALERLAERHPRQSRLAELRLFAGLTTREMAMALDVPAATVKREWKAARSWLAGELGSRVR